jgi:hypothetical protein
MFNCSFEGEAADLLSSILLTDGAYSDLRRKFGSVAFDENIIQNIIQTPLIIRISSRIQHWIYLK